MPEGPATAAEVVVWACCAPHRCGTDCDRRPVRRVARPRGRGGERPHRRHRDRPHRASPSCVKTDTDRIQVSAAPGADGIVRRMQQPAREGSHQLGGVRARQFGRRADRPADRRAALPHGRLRPAAGPTSGCRASSPSRRARATARSDRTAPPPTCSASRSIPARSSPSSPSCAPTACRSSICGSPTPTRTRSTRFTLYHGIVIGIAGLLALFLTILFVVKGSVMFPAAAALGWAVLVYIGIDFGFWGKVFDMSSGAERIWRASGEAILAATLLVFLFAYLNLSRWHVRYMHITAGLARRAGRAGRDRALIDPPVAVRHRPLSLAGIALPRLRAGDLSVDPRLRPRGAADPDLVPAGGLGGRAGR